MIILPRFPWFLKYIYVPVYLDVVPGYLCGGLLAPRLKFGTCASKLGPLEPGSVPGLGAPRWFGSWIHSLGPWIPRFVPSYLEVVPCYLGGVPGYLGGVLWYLCSVPGY